MPPTTIIAYLVAAALPAMALYLIYALDLYGTGKASTVLGTFAWGAVGAYLIARYVNNYVFLPFVGVENVIRLTGPITEEVAKALALIYLVTRPRFRYVVDGAVYGFAVGIGFSFSENIITYIPISGNAPIISILSRVLSATLMHATASALVGVAFGRLRRSRAKLGWPAIGIGVAIVLHIIYNNLVTTLSGVTLLLVAFGIGGVGFLLIFFLINQGLSEEKKSFDQTLRQAGNVVSVNDINAVQNMGGELFDRKLKEFEDQWGLEKVGYARRYSVLIANMGILQNNLASGVSERLREAWQAEIGELDAEKKSLVRRIGVMAMAELRTMFPENTMDINANLMLAISKVAPDQVHTFDIRLKFEAGDKLDAEQLERTAGMLQRAEIFKDVALADLENLSRAVKIHTFSPGETIFNEGDQGDRMYMIREGAINLYKHDAGGQDRLLRACGVGEIIGELALIDGSPRSAEARASGHVVALALTQEQFVHFIRSRPKVIIALLRYLANRVRSTTEALEARTNWAMNITGGNYTQAKAIGMMIPAEAEATPDAPPSKVGSLFKAAARAERSQTQEDSSTSAPVQASGFLGGAFSKVASALEKRESVVAKQLNEIFVGDELDELPAEHRQVLNAIAQDPIGISRGLTRDILQSKLEAISDLPGILQALDKNGWLIVAADGDEPRYKVNLNRKRGRGDTGIWNRPSRD